MHMLVKLIFITAAYMDNIARASGVCGKPELADNTVPLSDFLDSIGASIRIKCATGYVRKAGTSSLIRCTQQPNGSASWHSELPLKCIPDPRIPRVATTETQKTLQQITSCTTERTHPTHHGTTSPTTATGHIALTTTNEVVTTKTRRTTSQPTLMSTTKATESITTTNETTTSYTSREYMTTTSSHTLSGSFTTTTGVNASVRTLNISEEANTVAAFFDDYKSTIGGVTCAILLCLVPAVFLFLWFRQRNHRNQIVCHSSPDPNTSYIPLPVKAPENSTVDSVIDNNPGIPSGVDTCDELLPQADS